MDSFLRIRITFVTNVRDWVFFFFSWDQSTNYSGKVVVQFHDCIREKEAFKKWIFSLSGTEHFYLVR